MQKDFSNSLYSAPLLPGQIYDSSIQQADSYTAETAIKFGQPVQLGTDPAKQVKALGAGGTFFGIAIHSNIPAISGELSTKDTDDFQVKIMASNEGYPKGAMLPVLRLGRIAIKVTAVTEDTVNKTLAWYKLADGNIVAADKDPTGGYVAIGKFITKPVAGSLAVIQINNL